MSLMAEPLTAAELDAKPHIWQYFSQNLPHVVHNNATTTIFSQRNLRLLSSFEVADIQTEIRSCFLNFPPLLDRAPFEIGPLETLQSFEDHLSLYAVFPESKEYGIRYVGSIPIPKNAIVCFYLGEVAKDSKYSTFSVTCGPGYMVNAEHSGNLARFVNFSHTPNTIFREVSHANARGYAIAIVANRTIQPNEVISCDYGWKYSDGSESPISCYCGAKCCPKVVGWLPDDKTATIRKWSLYARIVDQNPTTCNGSSISQDSKAIPWELPTVKGSGAELLNSIMITTTVPESTDNLIKSESFDSGYFFRLNTQQVVAGIQSNYDVDSLWDPSTIILGEYLNSVRTVTRGSILLFRIWVVTDHYLLEPTFCILVLSSSARFYDDIYNCLLNRVVVVRKDREYKRGDTTQLEFFLDIAEGLPEIPLSFQDVFVQCGDPPQLSQENARFAAVRTIIAKRSSEFLRFTDTIDIGNRIQASVIQASSPPPKRRISTPRQEQPSGSKHSKLLTRKRFRPSQASQSAVAPQKKKTKKSWPTSSTQTGASDLAYPAKAYEAIINSMQMENQILSKGLAEYEEQVNEMTIKYEHLKAGLLRMKAKSSTPSGPISNTMRLQGLASKCVETKRNMEIGELKLQIERKDQIIQSLQSEVDLWKSAVHQLYEKMQHLDVIRNEIESTKSAMEIIFKMCNQ